MFDDSGSVGGVVFHVVAAADLARPAMAAPVMGDDAVALLDEEEHLRIPVVTAQGSAVMKDDRLTGAPVLVEDMCSVFGCDCRHGITSFFVPDAEAFLLCPLSSLLTFAAGATFRVEIFSKNL